MYELLTGFDWLAEEFSTQTQRIAITAIAIGLLVLVLATYRHLQSWLTRRLRPLYADIITTVLLLSVSVLTLSITIGVWDVTDDIADLLAQFDIGTAMIARMAVSFVILVMTMIVWRFVARLLHDVVANSSAVTDHQEEVSVRIMQVIIWSVAIVVVLSIWIDDLSGLLVGAGFLGIVLGMAARQTLGSILAGFVLMFARSFEVGHWVELDGREGIVTDISIFNTQIRAFDGEYIIVPNDIVTSSVVLNRSKTSQLRIEVEVGVDYEVDVEQAATLARDAIEDVAEAATSPEPSVITKEFGPSSVVLGVRFWIDNPNARKRATARTQAVNAIKAQFEGADVKIPYPQREVSQRHGPAEEDTGDSQTGSRSSIAGHEQPPSGTDGNGGDR
ncbi:mechanosensitive ion channel family protein [Natrialbaceae archaeon A-CW2]|uniref:mechanosensitive ion channel family protein n=1 Tax=Natronosalvus amylolyticus TaxID=2961994 RepID=UPI0020C93D6B|nr:mechanosensitive ion channel family protein [Natronosalvus amylolyticus]